MQNKCSAAQSLLWALRDAHVGWQCCVSGTRNAFSCCVPGVWRLEQSWVYNWRKQEQGTGRESAGRPRSGCSSVSILPSSRETPSRLGEEQTWKSFWVFTYCKEIAAVSKGKHVKANSPGGIAIGSQQKNASRSNVTDNPARAGGVGLQHRHGFVSTSAWAILASWQAGLWAAPGPRAFAMAKFLRLLLQLFFPWNFIASRWVGSCSRVRALEVLFP